MVKPPARVPLDSLVDLACRDGIDIRPTLLRVLTDLYVQKLIHSAEEETQYVELALGLIDAVDEQTRGAVTATLSTYPAAPWAVLLKLTGAALSTPDDHNRSEIENNELIDLFFYASPEERRLILANLDVATDGPISRPIPVASELIRRLENAALQRNAGEYGRVLERALGISRRLAERIVRDNSGEPIVVAAKALGIKSAVFQRILLFLNPVIGHSAHRIYELASLFEDLKPAVAERMLAIWQATSVRKPSEHAPVYWNDERSRARLLSTQATSRAVSTADRRPSRFKTNKT